MKSPIFSTSSTRKKAAKKAKAKPKPPTEKLWIEPRAYFSQISGTKEWVGCSAGVIRLDVADDRMNADGYWDGCQDLVVPVTDRQVHQNIREALADGFHTFVKQKVVKRNNDQIHKWLDLAVYTSETTEIMVFLDEGMGQGPDVVFGCTALFVEEDDTEVELVPIVVNHNDAGKVTLAVAPYLVDKATINKTRRQLGRKK